MKNKLLLISLILIATLAQAGVDFAMHNDLILDYISFVENYTYAPDKLDEYEKKIKESDLTPEYRDKVYQQVILINGFLKKNKLQYREYARHHIIKLKYNYSELNKGSHVYASSEVVK